MTVRILQCSIQRQTYLGYLLGIHDLFGTELAMTI
jgi:hypothetical protein